MNVTKCLNGHFYDADKYQLCPHCGAVSVAGNQSAPESSEKKTHPFFGKKKEQPVVDVVAVPDKTIGKTFGVFNNDNAVPESPKHIEPDPNVVPNVPKEEKVYIFGADSKGTPQNDSEVVPQPVQPVIENKVGDPSVEEQMDLEKDEVDSLRAAVKNVSAGSEGKTVGFFSTGNVESESEPVVGWLVCVKGKHFGESFNISAGRNAIGRGSNNKIILSKDSSVSREKHAWITYEPKKRVFYIQPGESSGLSYLNGDTIMESKALSGRDMLEFGTGTYMLVPLCGDDFTWEDYMSKE